MLVFIVNSILADSWMTWLDITMAFLFYLAFVCHSSSLHWICWIQFNSTPFNSIPLHWNLSHCFWGANYVSLMSYGWVLVMDFIAPATSVWSESHYKKITQNIQPLWGNNCFRGLFLSTFIEISKWIYVYYRNSVA